MHCLFARGGWHCLSGNISTNDGKINLFVLLSGRKPITCSFTEYVEIFECLGRNRERCRVFKAGYLSLYAVEYGGKRVAARICTTVRKYMYSPCGDSAAISKPVRRELVMGKNAVLLLNIGLAALIVIVLAMIVSDLIGFRLSRAPGPSVRHSAPLSATVHNDDFPSYGPILEKCLFGKAAGGKLTLLAGGQGKPTASPADLVLIGTVVGSFRETFALVQRQSTREERVFRLGDKVFDMGPLLSVSRESVEIGNAGKRVKLHVPTAVPGGDSTGPSAAFASGGMASQVSPGSYVVDQRSLAASLDNMGQAMTDARLLPSMKEGKVEGFRVSEVKQSGIFAVLGVKNGDTLLRINDFTIDSPDRAMQSLLSLKGQSRIKLDLIREGKPVSMNYDIR